MKKIKYLLHKTKKQKAKIQYNQKSQSQYLTTMKNQAIKTLQDFQQDCLNKTHLNITLRHSQRSCSQYRSRTEQKQNMRKTFLPQQLSTKSNNFRNQVLFETSSINIRKLLRIKTQAVQREVGMMKNPFYKIQKARYCPKKFSMIDKKQQIVIKQNNSMCLKQQQAKNNDESFFISRDKKEWYFASKKFRSRTVQNDQVASGVKKREESEQKMPQTLLTQKVMQQKQKASTKKHSKQQSGVSQLQDGNILKFKPSDSIINTTDNIKVQVSRQNSPSRIRQKSLTVQYNEIKDYFEKKYNKNTQYQRESDDDYLEQKFDNDI